jgi:hypothetical protein
VAMKTSGSTIRFAYQQTTFLVMAVLLILANGCKSGSESLWSATAASPDGKWIAKGQSVAQSGFGTGYIGTRVYLNWPQGSQPDVQILGLSYEYELPKGITKVDMRWLNNTHLELAYRGNPSVTFQAIKCGGVDITLQDVSSQSGSQSPK